MKSLTFSKRPALWDPVDCSPPGSFVCGILQARILEWVAISFSRASSRHRDRTQVFCIAGRRFNLWATREALIPTIFKFFYTNLDSIIKSRDITLLTKWETQVQSLGHEYLLEKEMATHSSILAWKIPWTEAPGRLQSMGSQRVGHDWATSLFFCFTFSVKQSDSKNPWDSYHFTKNLRF